MSSVSSRGISRVVATNHENRGGRVVAGGNRWQHLSRYGVNVRITEYEIAAKARQEAENLA